MNSKDEILLKYSLMGFITFPGNVYHHSVELFTGNFCHKLRSPNCEVDEREIFK